MFKNLSKLSNIIKAEGERIVDLDTSLIALFNNFHMLEDKEDALREYEGMLEQRMDISSIREVQAVLSDCIEVLDKFEVSKMDKKIHKQRIAIMKKNIKTHFNIEDDEEQISNKIESLDKKGKV